MNELHVTAIKVAKGKIELEYYDADQKRPYSTQESSQPHPDLFNVLKKLKQFLAKVYYVDDLEKIDINGFSGKYESTIVVIKGMLTVPSGKKVAINSDAIDLDKEIYGFEQDLDSVITEIQDEAKAFFFQGKQAQGTLEFEEEDDEDDFPPIQHPASEVTQEQKDADNSESLQEENQQSKPVTEQPAGPATQAL